jgi:hypothetical protein
MKGKGRNQSLLEKNLKKDTPFFGNFFTLLKCAARSALLAAGTPRPTGRSP